MMKRARELSSMTLDGPARSCSLRPDLVEAQRRVSRDPQSRANQGTDHIRCRLPPCVFEDEHPFPCQPLSCRCEDLVKACTILGHVRRIEQHDVEWFERRLFEKLLERAIGFRPDDSTAILGTADGQVLGDQRLSAAVVFDEGDRSRASAESLDAERACAGKNNQFPWPRSSLCENVEQCLAQLGGGRTQPRPCRRLQAPAFQRPADHAHGALRSVPVTRFEAIRFVPLTNLHQPEPFFPRPEELGDRSTVRSRQLKPAFSFLLCSLQKLLVANQI